MGSDNTLCQYLVWDSEFFGYRIGRVNDHQLTPASLRDIFNWCEVQNIECLYFLADPDPETIRLVEEVDFNLVDIRISLEVSLPVRESQSKQTEIRIRTWQETDLPRLRDIVRNSINQSRFFADPCFSHEASQGLYETWITRSCYGYADAVWVAEHNDQPAGFITCHLPDEDTQGKIGLVSVAIENRSQGIGNALIDHALNWFTSHRIKYVNVVTQGNNIAAQRLYQRCGFYTQKIQLWYHKWFINCSSKGIA